MLTMLVARSTGTISSFWMDEKVPVSPNFRFPTGGVGVLGAKTTTAMMLVAAARLVCVRAYMFCSIAGRRRRRSWSCLP